MMAAHAGTLRDRPERAARRVVRPAILLLVLALHAALLLLVSRLQTRIDFRSADSLFLLQLPSHVEAPAESPPVTEAPKKIAESSHETQLIDIPKEPPPLEPIEVPPPPRIDWAAEAALAAKHQAQAAAEPAPRALDQHGAGSSDFDGGLGPEFETRPEFGWDHARIHRIEPLEGGGSLLWLNDRCFIVMYGVIPFPMCGIGKIPPRGDLFDHMRDAPLQDPRSKTPP